MGLADRIRQALEGEPAVVAAWRFGSQARGTARPASDIDVAVLGDLDSWARIDLANRLVSALRKEADVVVFDTAPADLTHRVLRDGVLVLDRDRARRIAAEVRKQNEYFDMTPIWRLAVTDRSLVDKRLTLVEACIRDLALIDPAAIELDIVRERFAEHTLQIAIQAVIDIAAHIVADERLGTATTRTRSSWICSHGVVGYRSNSFPRSTR